LPLWTDGRIAAVASGNRLATFQRADFLLVTMLVLARYLMLKP
jgi:hypothetical protein